MLARAEFLLVLALGDELVAAPIRTSVSHASRAFDELGSQRRLGRARGDVEDAEDAAHGYYFLRRRTRRGAALLLLPLA